jgi:hypothetical protein
MLSPDDPSPKGRLDYGVKSRSKAWMLDLLIQFLGFLVLPIALWYGTMWILANGCGH